MKNPNHPGEMLRVGFIEPMNLQIGAVAAHIGVARPTLSKIVNGRAGISADMAVRLEKAFGWKADLWMKLQAAYDLSQAREREDEIAGDIEALAVNAA